MTASIFGHTPFVGFGRIVTSPTIQMPSGTNSAIVVVLGGSNTLSSDNTLFKSVSGIGMNMPVQVITDNMGNVYTRVASVNTNSLLINPLLYEEVWIAIVNTPITKPIQIIATYPATTLVSADVIILTPANPQNQLSLDNSFSAAENVNADFGSLGIGSSINFVDGLTPSANELILSAVNYIYVNMPQTTNPTPPLVSGVSPTILIDNVTNIGQFQSPQTNGIANFIGVGLAILAQTFGPSLGNMVLSINAQGQSVVSFIEIAIGIQEVPVGQGSLPTVTAPIINTPVSPENLAFVPTLTPGLNVIKLPAGT